MDLTRGANASLASRGKATVTVTWAGAPGDLDISCYLLAANGKVPSDEHMVFYNQPADPSGAVRFTGQASSARFAFDLDRLPTHIDRGVIAATLAGGTFQQVRDLVVSAQGDGGPIRYRLTEAASERAMRLAEVYRHTGGWKFRAIGQGFNGGLKALAESFGVVVEDAPAAPAPLPLAKPRATPPQPSPIRLGKIVLDKPNAEAKLSLTKHGGLQNVHVRMTWQAGVDLDLHAFYRHKNGAVGHVYFVNKGSKSGPPYIELDQDAAVNRRAGDHEENLTIVRLDEFEEILFAANIFTLGGLIGLGNQNFAKYDGVVTIIADNQEIIVPLTSEEPGRWAVVAKLDNRTEAKVIRIDQVVKREPKLDDYR